MAASSLRDDATCSVCLEFFRDPVSIHCGHSFCCSCISRAWDGLDGDFSCPRCRLTAPQRSFRPNWDLAKVVEVAKSLEEPRGEAGGGENVCEEHREPLKLFCEEEKKLLCLVCDRSKVHREHSVVPVGEAAREYKEQIQTYCQWLKEEQGELESSLKAREEELQAHAKRTEQEKRKIVARFKQLRKFLDEEEAAWLSKLEKLDKEVTDAHQRVLKSLSEEKTKLEMHIEDTEVFCQRPDCEFLKGVETTLKECMSLFSIARSNNHKRLSRILSTLLEPEVKFEDFLQTIADTASPGMEFQEKLLSLLW